MLFFVYEMEMKYNFKKWIKVCSVDIDFLYPSASNSQTTDFYRNMTLCDFIHFWKQCFALRQLWSWGNPGSPGVVCNANQCHLLKREPPHQHASLQDNNEAEKKTECLPSERANFTKVVPIQKRTADSCYISQISLLINMWQRLQDSGTFLREDN